MKNFKHNMPAIDRKRHKQARKLRRNSRGKQWQALC